MSYYRKIRTTAERRAVADATDEGIRVRAKRANLPHEWDDIQPSRAGRTWKRHRRNRWK